MPWSLDARIPVYLGPATPADDGVALLIEGTLAHTDHPAESFTPEPTGHAPGCACCVARGPAAIALDRLFQRRARGEVPFFRRVIAVTASPEGDLAVWSALRDDPLASARFRLDQSGTS
jgi:hypothetical protein